MKLKNILYAIIFAATLSSCNDDSMDKFPQVSQTEQTAFITTENFRTYTWSLYDIFNKSGMIGHAIASNGYYNSDYRAGYITSRGINDQVEYADQTAVVPQTGGGWDYTNIRRINIMLSNIEGSQMTNNEKDHWKAVGLFFHSFNYIELIMRFGDVPWIDFVYKEEDALKEIERIPREQAADKVLANLKWAEDNMNKTMSLDYDGKNTINKNVVMALINRFALQEGTWRKYHKSGGDYIPYLKEVVRTGDMLFKLYPNIAADYDKKFNSEDLSTYQGMILYKEYSQASMKHQIGGLERSSSSPYETHKAMVEMFLSQNGLPIKNASNTTYDGDKTMYDEFRNRDFRLLLNVTPPFKVTGAGSMNKWGFTKDPKDREYIDYMRANCRPFGKQLPLMNAAAPSYGSVVGNVPHFLGQDGQPFCVCRSGYYMWKHYNLEDNNPAARNSFDMPIFAIEEILLNYAEAKFELGEFGQDVADKTINKLRPRAKVAPMDVSLINNSFDPERDQTVDPVLWEIRRERITELFGEGFGFYDIRRWKRADWFINRKQLGVYVHRTDFGGLKDAVKIDGGGKEGYVYLYSDPVKEMGKGWKDTYYLYPIPRQELTLNKKLIQNPGWDLE